MYLLFFFFTWLEVCLTWLKKCEKTHQIKRVNSIKCLFEFSVFRWIIRCVFPHFFFPHFTCFALSQETIITVAVLFMYYSNTVYVFKNIKNGSYDTIYIFKNYFVTVFSIFNFSNNLFFLSFRLFCFRLGDNYHCSSTVYVL